MVPIAAICGFVLDGCGSGGGGGLVVKTVSEYGGTPIGGVKVQVGEQGWTTTGANGEARFAPAATPYTVRIHQRLETTVGGRSRQNDKVWQLVGQTANPLAVEVDGSLAQIYKSRLAGSVAGRSGAPNTRVLVLGSPVGPDRTFGSANGPLVWWEGGTRYDFTLRAVESDTNQPPAHYAGYAAGRVTVTDTTGLLGQGGNLTGVGLQLAPVAESSVAGRVALAEGLSAASLRSQVALRFSQSDWLELGEGSGQPATFQYTVPIVSGGELWVRFFASPTAPASTVAAFGFHHRKVALPSTGVSLDVPAPVSLTEPAEAATFGPATLFRWSAGPAGGKYSLDLSCGDWSEGAVTRNIHYRGIETTTPEVALPAIPDVVVPAGTSCSWAVDWIALSDPSSERRGSRSFERGVTAQ